jgi:hypothetical protein
MKSETRKRWDCSEAMTRTPTDKERTNLGCVVGLPLRACLIEHVSLRLRSAEKRSAEKARARSRSV